MAETALGLGILVGKPQSVSLDEVKVLPLRPTFALSKNIAKELSGLGNEDPKIVVVGAGALGSQVILNLARQGFGVWSIIDNDRLLPHNFSRHALSQIFEGQNKAQSLALEINALLNDGMAASWYPLNILDADQFRQLQDVFDGADVIIDLSASHSVARTLAQAEFTMGRICGFLSPNGRYLALLSEGQARSIRLDDLEVQLAVHVAEKEQFQDMYKRADGLVTYAGSCRDISFQLPQDVVAMHAATASQFIKKNYTSVEPSINLWEWSATNFSLAHSALKTYSVIVEQKNNWAFRTSEHALIKMRYYRRCHLPNETGGVLLGKIDFDTETIYIGTVLPSPPDSIEWPTVYIRGVKGLLQQVERFKEVSGGDLSYVGEWHSHPEGHSANPSEDDRKALEGLKSEIWIDGVPGIIAILGDKGTLNYLI